MTMLPTKNKCCGCGNCALICPKNCISMLYDKEGFIYPLVNKENCISCGRCEMTCPVINPPTISSETIAYAVKNNDTAVRINSSSGGFFSLLAQFVINQNGVVYGAAYDSSFRVVHRRIERIGQLDELRGAKYAQSSPYIHFQKLKYDLDHDRYVLFTGTPCQTSSLKRYLAKDYDRLILADIVCHGVPSPLVWEKYLAERQHEDAAGAAVQSINQRSKISGWSKYSYSIEIKYKNQNTYCAKQSNDAFMRGFVNNLYLRPSCSDCNFKGYHRVSDFTLGDCWGIWDFAPEMDDNKGISLILLHTKKAQTIWDQLSKQAEAIELNSKIAVSQNPSILTSSIAHPKRAEFFNKINGSHSVSKLISKCIQPESNSAVVRYLRKIVGR